MLGWRKTPLGCQIFGKLKIDIVTEIRELEELESNNQVSEFKCLYCLLNIWHLEYCQEQYVTYCTYNLHDIIFFSVNLEVIIRQKYMGFKYSWPFLSMGLASGDLSICEFGIHSSEGLLDMTRSHFLSHLRDVLRQEKACGMGFRPSLVSEGFQDMTGRHFLFTPVISCRV